MCVKKIPLLAHPVPAGFPNPANDHIEREVDLNRELIDHPAATFFVRVEGHSMTGAGIHHGDILIVDKSLNPTHGSIVIAVIDGEFTVKRLIREKGQTLLRAESEGMADIRVQPVQQLDVWGIVTYVIHKC